MTDRAFLRLLGDKVVFRDAVSLLRIAELQPADDDGDYCYLHELRNHRTTSARMLARHAYAHANPNLGSGWRHRYCRAATWLVAERKRRWLELPAPKRVCPRCRKPHDGSSRTCAPCLGAISAYARRKHAGRTAA